MRPARQGREVAIATALDGDAAGARLAIIGDQVVGSLGGPELLDHNVAREARGLLEEGKTPCGATAMTAPRLATSAPSRSARTPRRRR